MAFQKRGDLGSAKNTFEESPRLVSIEQLTEDVRQDLLGMLNRGFKSSKDLRQRMLDLGHPMPIVDELIERFTEVGLIDDAIFAEVIVNNRRTRGRLSKSAIKRELIDKGVPAEIAESSLSEITDDDEFEQAKELVLRRWSQVSRLDSATRYRRLSGFLSRKGYQHSVVSLAIRFVEQQEVKS
jgi:regulatory protein